MGPYANHLGTYSPLRWVACVWRGSESKEWDDYGYFTSFFKQAGPSVFCVCVFFFFLRRSSWYSVSVEFRTRTWSGPTIFRTVALRSSLERLTGSPKQPRSDYEVYLPRSTASAANIDLAFYLRGAHRSCSVCVAWVWSANTWTFELASSWCSRPAGK